MADLKDSFLREVDEDIRREQLMKLWEKYGIFAIAGLVALFVAVGAWKWHQASSIAAEETTGARYEAATNLIAEGKTDDAVKALADIVKDSPAGYRTVSRLRLAGAEAKAGHAANALAAYEAVANDAAADDLLRDFAALQAAVLRLDQADWTEMKNRLTPLTEENRAWHAPAREILGLAAFKAGDTDTATKLYEQIMGDRASSSGLTRRAQEMLAVLTDAAAAKAPASAPKAVSPEPAKPKK